MKKRFLTLKIVTLLAVLLSFTAEAGSRPLGASCMLDGQCASRECKGFKCIKLEDALKPLGAACMTDGQCGSGECKKFKCIEVIEGQIGAGNKILNSMMKKFSKMTPVLEKAGFETGAIRIEVKLIPVITVDMKQVKVISRKEQKKIMRSLKGKIFASTFMKVLFAAHNLQFDNYEVKKSRIQLNPPPKAFIILTRKK
jgi:hypothetical protein